MHDDRTLPEVAADVAREVRRLTWVHVALASAEIRESARGLAADAARLAVAGALALLGLAALLTGGALALVAWGVPAWAAALMVAGLCVIVAAVLGAGALGRLRRVDVLPHTLAALRRTLDTVEETVS